MTPEARDADTAGPELAGQSEPGERQLVTDTGKLSGAIGTSYLINLVGGLILARLLGPALYGVWKAVQLAGTYSAFSNVGATFGIDRTCPSLVSRGRLGTYRRLVAASLGFNLVLALLLGAAVVALALPMEPGPARTAFLAFALLVVVQPFFQHGEAALNVEKRFGTRAKVTLASTTIRVVASIAAAVTLGLPGVLAVYVAVVAWAAWYMLRRTRLNLSTRGLLRYEAPLVRRLIRVGLPITLLVFGEQFFTTIDKWLVLALLGAETMGHYQMAIFPLPILLLVPFALRQVVSMDIYDKFGQTGRLDICRPVFERSVAAIALGVPVVIGAVYFGVPWLVDWFLAEYRVAIAALKLHAILIYPVLMIQTGFALAVVARREFPVILALVGGGVAAGALSTASTLWLGGDMLSILAIHGSAWTLFGAAFLYKALRWVGGTPDDAMMRVMRWFIPMIYVGIEMPLVEWLLMQMNLRPYSLPFALLGGLIHVVACVPFLVVLERRTAGVSHALRLIGRRFGRHG